MSDVEERASTHERLAESLLELARTLVATDSGVHNDGADPSRRVVGDRTMTLLAGDGSERLTLSVEEAAQVLGISRAARVRARTARRDPGHPTRKEDPRTAGGSRRNDASVSLTSDSHPGFSWIRKCRVTEKEFPRDRHGGKAQTTRPRGAAAARSCVLDKFRDARRGRPHGRVKGDDERCARRASATACDYPFARSHIMSIQRATTLRRRTSTLLLSCMRTTLHRSRS